MKLHLFKKLHSRQLLFRMQICCMIICLSLFTHLSQAQILSYCSIPAISNPEPITSVKIGTVKDSFSNVVDATTPFYRDRSSVILNDLQNNVLIEVKSNTNGPSTQQIYAFIDWNIDGDFDDVAEIQHIGSITNSNGADGKHISFNLWKSSNATFGETKLRIISTKSTTPPSLHGCSIESEHGQVIDYTLNIVPSYYFTLLPDCANNEFKARFQLFEFGSFDYFKLTDGEDTIIINSSTHHDMGPYPVGALKNFTLLSDPAHGSETILTLENKTLECELAHDDCSGAMNIVPTYDNDTTTVAFYGSSAVSAHLACYTPLKDIWLKFTASENKHLISIDKNFKIYDEKISATLYQGNCSAFASRNCFSGDNIRMIATNLNIGQTYYLKVGSTHEGVFHDSLYVRITPFTASAPTNDDTAYATSITVAPDEYCIAPTIGSLANATPTVGLVNSCDANEIPNQDVWYKFIASNTELIFKVYNPEMTYYSVQVYKKDGSSFNQVHCSSKTNVSGNRIKWTDLIIGQTYYIRMSTNQFISEPSKQFEICLGMETTTTNDACANAIPLTVNSSEDCTYKTNFSTINATYNGDEVAPTGECNLSLTSNRNDVWFSFVATNDTLQTTIEWEKIISYISLPSISFYKGLDCGSKELIYCNRSTDYNKVRIDDLIVGQKYYIRIQTDGQMVGNLCLREVPKPSNDEATGAFWAIGSALGTTYKATYNPLEPLNACTELPGESSPSVWFKFKPNNSTKNCLITTGYDTMYSLNDTRIGIFTSTDSSDYSTFQLIACDDNNGYGSSSSANLKSSVYLTDLDTNQTYYIKVNSPAGTQDSFRINLVILNSFLLETAASCATSAGKIMNSNENYNGVSSLVNNEGKLRANVRILDNHGGGLFSNRLNISTVTDPRMDASGNYYLDRSYSINSINENVEVQLFFTKDELEKIGTTIDNLEIVKTPGTTCVSELDEDSEFDILVPTSVGKTYNNSVYWVKFITPGFSNFFIRPSSSPLNTLMGNINGKNTIDGNLIEWNLMDESNINEIILERSMDGRTFESIYNIVPTYKKDYHFVDATLQSNINYYRIKLTTHDGQFQTSKTIQLISKKVENYIVIAPNPNNGNFEIARNQVESAIINFYDALGNLIKTETWNVGDRMNISLNDLPAGNYWLNYQSNQFNNTIQFIKQ